MTLFWSSVVLTGNPTEYGRDVDDREFWSSVVLTGNPTYRQWQQPKEGFGAVSF